MRLKTSLVPCQAEVGHPVQVALQAQEQEAPRPHLEAAAQVQEPAEPQAVLHLALVRLVVATLAESVRVIPGLGPAGLVRQAGVPVEPVPVPLGRFHGKL